MVEYTSQMAAYETACKMFEARGISYEEESIDGYNVTFLLTKDGFTGRVIINCDSALIVEQTNYAIGAFEQMATWDKAEPERKRKRGRKC